MSELPRISKLFDPPPEQLVVPGQVHDYVGVYCICSHITIVTKQAPGVFPKVELWRPIFECGLPANLQAVDSGFFVLWFAGIPSERARFGACAREVRVISIARAEQGRGLGADEYTW